jgi:hypothetical protein
MKLPEFGGLADSLNVTEKLSSPVCVSSHIPNLTKNNGRPTNPDSSMNSLTDKR